MFSSRSLGSAAEQQAALFLKDQGYTICAQNYRKRYGEVDIIAQKKSTIAFVEVKARHTITFSLSEVITPSKQSKIIKTARAYIAQEKLYNVALRFDVILAQPIANQSYQFTHITNAFGPTDSDFVI